MAQWLLGAEGRLSEARKRAEQRVLNTFTGFNETLKIATQVTRHTFFKPKNEFSRPHFATFCAIYTELDEKHSS